MSLPDSIDIVESHYLGPTKMSAYLLVEGDRAAFVDNGTRYSVPYLLEALAARGMSPDQVEYLIITHVHLDHAGGTAELLKHCPRATVIAHPKAARHVCRPEKLVQGAIGVYGAELFRELYGEIEEIPEERVRPIDDETVLAWGDRRLRFFNTLGHASHHFCIHDDKTNSVFTGDNFGVGRSAMLRPGPPVLICSCTPAEFDAVEAKKSVEKIVETGAERAYIGHYGAFTDMARGAEQVLRSIDAMQAILDDALAADCTGPEQDTFISDRVRAATDEQLQWCGVTDPESDRRWLDGDLMLNALGLKFALARIRKARSPGHA